MTGEPIVIVSPNAETTRALAGALALNLVPGDLLALIGELGSGKTEFVRGLAQGLEVPAGEGVTSPTFILAHTYSGRLTLVHLDLYRLDHLPPDLLPDLEDYLSGPHVVAVEWADRALALLPKDYLEIRLAITGEQERRLIFIPHGPRGRELLKKGLGIAVAQKSSAHAKA